MRRNTIQAHFENYEYPMSRRAKEAIANNEFPVFYWTKRFSITASQVEQLLIYMGIHHTGVNYYETKFYRLPDKYDTQELMFVYNAFHAVPVSNLTLINTLAGHLQLDISDRYTRIPLLQKPRKRIKRSEYRKGGRRRIRKYRVI